MLHTGTVIDENAGFFERDHVGGRRLPIMGLHTSRSQISNGHHVAAYLACEIIHGVEACDHG